MCNLVKEIALADDVEIQELLQAVLQRYTQLFPEWEISTISLSKSADRNKQLDSLIAMLQNMRSSS